MENPMKEVKKYLFMIYKKRFVFLFSSLAVMLIIIAGSFFMQKKYVATSTVFIERSMIDSLMRGLTITPSMSDRIRVLRYSMLSRDLISRTLKELDADLMAPTPAAFESMIEKYRARTEINVRGNDLFIVSLKDENPAFARDFINALVGKYVEENIASKRQETFGATRFLDEQLEHFKAKMNQAQDQVTRYRQENGIYSSVDEPTILANIKKYEEAIETLQIQKNEMRATIETIRNQLEMMRTHLAARPGKDLEGYLFESGGGGGSNRVAQLENKVDELLLVYNERHPEVIRTRALIQAVKVAEKRKEAEGGPEVESSLDSFSASEDPVFVDLKMRLNAKESELQALEARQSELEGMILASKEELRDVPDEKKILAELERERRTYQRLYEELLQRQGVAEVSQHMEVSDKATTFRIVDPAVLSRRPVTIDRFKVMLMGVFAGFAVGFGLVFLLEKLDGRFKDPDSIRQLGLPVLVEIPTIPNPLVEAQRARLHRLGYTFAACGFLVVGATLMHDVLGLGLIDQAIDYSQLDVLVGKFIQ